MSTLLISSKKEGEMKVFKSLIEKHKNPSEPRVFKFDDQYFMITLLTGENTDQYKLQKLDLNNLPQGIVLP